MSKGKLCAGVISVIILLSFGCSIYLMTTVNPPPLKIDPEHIALLEDFQDKIYVDEEDYEHDIVDPVNNPWKVFAPFYRYGLHKVTKSFDEAENSSSVPFHTFRKFVYPPMYPPRRTTESGSFKNNNELKETTTEDQIYPHLKSNVTNMTRTYLDSINKIETVKDLRRSIKSNRNKSLDDNSGYIKIQIIDTNGMPKIEIKLNSHDSSGSDRKLEKTSNHLKLNVQRNNVQDDISELGRSTEIKILPNQSIVINSDGNINSIIKKITKTEKVYDLIPIKRNVTVFRHNSTMITTSVHQNSVFTIVPNIKNFSDGSKIANKVDEPQDDMKTKSNMNNKENNETKKTNTVVELNGKTKTTPNIKDNTIFMIVPNNLDTRNTQNLNSVIKKINTLVTNKLKNNRNTMLNIKNSSMETTQESQYKPQLFNITSEINSTNLSPNEEILSNIMKKEVNNLFRSKHKTEHELDNNTNMEIVKSVVKENISQSENKDKNTAIINLTSLESIKATKNTSAGLIKQLIPALKNISELKEDFIIRNMNTNITKRSKPIEPAYNELEDKHKVIVDLKNISSEVNKISADISDKTKKIFSTLVRNLLESNFNHTRSSNISATENVTLIKSKDINRIKFDSKNNTLEIEEDESKKVPTVQYGPKNDKTVSHFENYSREKDKDTLNTYNSNTEMATSFAVTKFTNEDISKTTTSKNVTKEKSGINNKDTTRFIEEKTFGYKIQPFTESYRVANSVEISTIADSIKTRFKKSSSSSLSPPSSIRL